MNLLCGSTRRFPDDLIDGVDIASVSRSRRDHESAWYEAHGRTIAEAHLAEAAEATWFLIVSARAMSFPVCEHAAPDTGRRRRRQRIGVGESAACLPRLSLPARAVDPGEATSVTAELLIQRAMRASSYEDFIIAHRLSAIRDADHILVPGRPDRRTRQAVGRRGLPDDAGWPTRALGFKLLKSAKAPRKLRVIRKSDREGS